MHGAGKAQTEYEYYKSMFPRRNFKILLIFLIFCSCLLIYSLSLITTKEIVNFSRNSNNINIIDKFPPPLSAYGSNNKNRYQVQPYQSQSQQQQQQHDDLLLYQNLNGQEGGRGVSKGAQENPLINEAVNEPRVDGILQKPAFTKSLNIPGPLFRGDLPGEKRRNIIANVGPALGSGAIGGAIGLRGFDNHLHHQHDQEQQYSNSNNRQLTSELPLLKIPYKLVHIDLKGAPPKLSYLKSVLEIIKETGGNGVLLEYEDMFPFSGGGLNGTSHLFHYSQNDITDLISTATNLGLEIIPLVQTFGHLEFILKLERFRHLREVDDFPQEICPKNEVAWSLVTTLIDQVVSLHKDSQYIHIGCDEVFHIGECTRCHGKDTKELFLGHVKRVANYIYDKYRKRSIIWDDMLRKFYVEELLPSDIGQHVELMIWDYTEDVDRLVSPYLWPMYGQIFPNIWIASAYKGAFGETFYTVDVQRHAFNHLSWLRVLNREQHRIKNLRGFVVTGWSRYDHFAVLCELLPVAIPSLVLSLQLLVKQNLDDASKMLFKYLKCDPGSVLKLEECIWNGADLFNAMRSLKFYEEQTKLLITQHRSEKGWLSPYNIKYNYSSPWRLAEPMQMAAQYLTSIQTFETTIQYNMKNYYEQHVVDEWIEQKLEPIIRSLELLISDCQSLSSRKSWERRPPVKPPDKKKVQ